MTASDSTTITNKNDSIITLVLNKDDAYYLRRYIVELEYSNVKYLLVSDKLLLVEQERTLWKETALNYKNQRDLTKKTLDSQVELTNKISSSILTDLKSAEKRGKKKGFIKGVSTSVALIIGTWLLVK